MLHSSRSAKTFKVLLQILPNCSDVYVDLIISIQMVKKKKVGNKMTKSLLVHPTANTGSREALRNTHIHTYAYVHAHINTGICVCACVYIYI